MQVLCTILTIQLKVFFKNMVIVLLITATFHLRVFDKTDFIQTTQLKGFYWTITFNAKWLLFLSSIFYTVIYNNLFEANCCKSKKDICLYRKNDNALNNQAPVPKNNSTYSVSNNAALALSKVKKKFRIN